MIDGWGRGRGDGGGGGGGGGVEGVERLNVSTWLVIQSDYHRLTAPNGRHPRLLSLPSLHCLSRVRESESQRGGGGAGRLPVCVCVCVCVCERDESAVDGSQTDPARPHPYLARATQGTRGTSRVQRARRPPAWRRQLVEAAASRAAIGRREAGGVQTVDLIKKIYIPKI